MTKKIYWIIPVLAFLLVFTAVSCSTFTGFKRNYSGTSTNTEITGTYDLLNGTQTKTISLKENQVMNFNYKSTVETGTLKITIENPDKETMVEFPTNTSGTAILGADKAGDYRVVIVGVNTQGSFSVKWKITAGRS